jgi:hypothetical protein
MPSRYLVVSIKPLVGVERGKCKSVIALAAQLEEKPVSEFLRDLLASSSAVQRAIELKQKESGRK